MKKKLLMGFSVIFLLALVMISTPVSAASSFVGHSFSEDYFAVEVDVAVVDPANPDLIRDLYNASAATGDSDETEDKQFFFAYMNNSGIETGFSALEKYEHNLTLLDLFHDDIKTVLDSPLFPQYQDALRTPIFHINATAPFQQLVQHWTVPWDNEEVFVTNNFMSLIAYSSNSTDTTMDAGDEIYMGYTFGLQEGIDGFNDVFADNGHSYRINHFDYFPFFETVENGYRFGINYTNLFVLWQPISVELGGIDILGDANLVADNPGGIVFGKNIVAASVLDYLSFEYEFTTQINSGANAHVLGTTTTHYNIGETNFLVIAGETVNMSETWDYSPFTDQPNYTFQMPSSLVSVDVLGKNIPASKTVFFPNMAFYFNDDAKRRMNMQNGFGLTVATATTSIGLSNPEHTDETDNPTQRRISLDSGGNTFFYTEFTGKYTYLLQGLENAPWNIDPAVPRNVEIHLFDPTNWAWAIPDVSKVYFKLEFALAYQFTKWFAVQLEPGLLPPGDEGVYFNFVLYFTFTEFPEWYGGEIIHDPAYSAVAALAAGDTTTTGPGPGDTTTGPISGFELLSVVLAIPPLVALYRKRR
ncbi:MAG: Heimdall-CTERM domain-containing surface protein [Candidatus Thorarchaeota archaeon]